MNLDISSLLAELWQVSGIFSSGRYSLKNGVFFFESKRPEYCDLCASRRFHAHGHYPRGLWTLRNGELEKVPLGNKRWLCYTCGHTVSFTPPDLLRRRRACLLVIFLLLFCYLSSDNGYETCAQEPLLDFACGKKIARYLTQARKCALETQQTIREVLMEEMEPDAWRNTFLTGLDPPETLLKRQRRHLPEISILWRAFKMLLIVSHKTHKPVATLLARAHEKSLQLHRPFLL